MSQGYDGASVMSGCCSGIQERIKAVAPMAVYIHCYVHCLNLVLVDSTKSIPEAAEFFALLEVLYVFMSASKAHSVYTQQQTILHPEKAAHQLQGLADFLLLMPFAVHTMYRIMQIVRGGKLSRLHALLVIRGKTFAIS